MNQPPERQPQVSVIMNCLNCGKYLKEAIDSVYAQTYQDWEIIFWDNASTDNSAEIARGYDARLRYFRGSETVPLGAARNLALRQARGEFIAFLDCDDLWRPEKLAKQVPLFDDPEVGLVFCDTIFFNESGDTRQYYRGRSYYTGHCFAELLADYCLSLETVVIRRATLAGEGTWFDPRFNLIEEADLFLRIAYRWQLAMVDEPLAKWRVHAASWTWTKNYLAAPEREAMLLKFQETIPDFRTRFAREIALVERSNAISWAKNLWKGGESRAARRKLVPFLIKNKKALILYFLTFLPEEKVASFINKMRNRIIPQ